VQATHHFLPSSVKIAQDINTNCRAKSRFGLVRKSHRRQKSRTFVKYWELIAHNLSKAGSSWGCVSVIEIRPYRNGWKCFEAPGVEPVFLDQQDAIDYATGRACFRSGEIRILDSSGNLESTIPFNEE
jgi:hypothetical protein